MFASVCRPGNTLYLEGEGRGIVNNMCFPSEVARSYAPAGQVRCSACSARVVGLWNLLIGQAAGRLACAALPADCPPLRARLLVGSGTAGTIAMPRNWMAATWSCFKHGCCQWDASTWSCFKHGCYQWDGRYLEFSLEVAPSTPLVQTLVSVSTIGTLDELSEQQLIDAVKQVGCAAAAGWGRPVAGAAIEVAQRLIGL